MTRRGRRLPTIYSSHPQSPGATTARCISPCTPRVSRWCSSTRCAHAASPRRLAILGRLVHAAFGIELTGPSMNAGSNFASRALALGESLPMIGRLLVHSEVQTTERYAHLASDLVKDSAVSISESIAADILTGYPGQEGNSMAEHRARKEDGWSA